MGRLVRGGRRVTDSTHYAGDGCQPAHPDPSALALIAWIEGACTDELPHREIQEAINRWQERNAHQ